MESLPAPWQSASSFLSQQLLAAAAVSCSCSRFPAASACRSLTSATSRLQSVEQHVPNAVSCSCRRAHCPLTILPLDAPDAVISCCRRARHAVVQEQQFPCRLPANKVFMTCIQAQFMEKCDGPGIIALVSAALTMDGKPLLAEGLTIKELDDVIRQGLMPPDELEFDCRGKLDVTKSKFAYVDIGEVKSKPKYGTAIDQLGVRLSVVAWLLGKCCLVSDKDVRRVGRVFVPRGSHDSASSSAQSAALKEWGFSLYVHRL